MLGPHPRGSDLIGLECGLASEMFKSSSGEVRVRTTGLSPAGCFLCGLSVMGAGDPEINSPKHFLHGLCGILGLLPSDGL